jgi:hypothetical protein
MSSVVPDAPVQPPAEAIPAAPAQVLAEVIPAAPAHVPAEVIPVAPSEASSEPDENWGDRLYSALQAITYRVAAASKHCKQSPNPMIQVVGPGDVLNLGFPLEKSQLDTLRTLGKLVHPANSGLEVIPHEFVTFCNGYWSTWITDTARELVRKTFLVDHVEVQYEYAFVVSGDHPVAELEQS